MKSENNLSCPRYNNLIISILTLVFCLNFNQEKIISLKGSNNSLKPIYEISNGDTVQSISNVTTAVVNKKEVQSQNTYQNYYVKPSYNSLTGTNLVNYAKKYLGLPYIPAGSSLASGTDCSGFTRLIFQELGINLGRTVASQLYSGSYVAKEDLKPGDLVFYGYYQGYSSHVAIYIGDGLIIHESNPRDGVKISSVNIMVYQTARRLITENVVSSTSLIDETKEKSVVADVEILDSENNQENSKDSNDTNLIIDTNENETTDDKITEESKNCMENKNKEENTTNEEKVDVFDYNEETDINTDIGDTDTSLETNVILTETETKENLNSKNTSEEIE